MLLGSGIKGAGGALLGYRAGLSAADGGSSLAAGWRYEGPVCSVSDLAAAAAAELEGGGSPGGSPGGAAVPAAAAAHELGEVWECPLLARLPRARSGGGSGEEAEGEEGEEPLWLLAVSPYPKKPPHHPSNPVLYWVGRMEPGGSRWAAAGRLLPNQLCRRAFLCRHVGRISNRPTPGSYAMLPAGLTSPRPRAPSDSTWERCSMLPTCAKAIPMPRCMGAWARWLLGVNWFLWMHGAASQLGALQCAARCTFLIALAPSPSNEGVVQGRLLMWAWLQERRPPGSAATYAGCLTVPRVLRASADGRRLVQQPAPEIARLRRCFGSHGGAGGDAAPTSPAAAAAAAAEPEVAPGFSAKGGWYAGAALHGQKPALLFTNTSVRSPSSSPLTPPPLRPAEAVEVAEGQLLEIDGVGGCQLDVELTFSRQAHLLTCMTLHDT